MKQFVSRHGVACLCLAFLAVLVLAAAFAPLLTSVDPLSMSPTERMKPPSAAHWFGTDSYGRDVFVRTLYGGRVSLLVGISVTVLATVAGTLIGLVSGYLPLLDKILMRVMDGIMSIPGVVLAVA